MAKRRTDNGLVHILAVVVMLPNRVEVVAIPASAPLREPAWPTDVALRAARARWQANEKTG
jgi:hypothetical protein